ncbi:MAG: sulfatase-like hydrolase/transferase [Oligoflexia bacterium]|nr:sulfatase-like hydrolase/transferase [Oligoflexia bacterium]
MGLCLFILGRDRGLHIHLPVPQARPTLPTIVLIVLDTVRADRTSMCGATRPTTPRLNALAQRPDTVATCQAIAPGAWTVPTHAAFFTGLMPWEHRADFASDAELVGWLHVRPLPSGVKTLAEQLSARGYQSVLISANPTLGLPLGLDRGFALKRFAPRRGGDHDWLIENLGTALRERAVYKAAGLFLVVNIFDAHNPRPATDPSLGWVPRWGPIQYGDPTSLRYLQGVLPQAQAQVWREHMVDSYDYSLTLADDALGRSLELLQARGWLGPDTRLIVTADHGELLGEFGAYGHGSWVSEATQRVPFVSMGLPECSPASGWLSLGTVFSLLRDGVCTPQPGPAIAAARPNADVVEISAGRHGRQAMFGLWSDTHMLHASDDIETDWVAETMETTPDPDPQPALHKALQAVRAAYQIPPPPIQAAGQAAEEVERGLRALGYVE